MCELSFKAQTCRAGNLDPGGSGTRALKDPTFQNVQYNGWPQGEDIGQILASSISPSLWAENPVGDYPFFTPSTPML